MRLRALFTSICLLLAAMFSPNAQAAMDVSPATYEVRKAEITVLYARPSIALSTVHLWHEADLNQKATDVWLRV